MAYQPFGKGTYSFPDEKTFIRELIAAILSNALPAFAKKCGVEVGLLTPYKQYILEGLRDRKIKVPASIKPRLHRIGPRKKSTRRRAPLKPMR